MDQGGNRRGVGKGQHGGVIPFQQSLVHHTGEDACEHLRQPGQEVLCRQVPRAHVPVLLQGEHLPRLHDLLVVDRKIHHPHSHGDEIFQGIRHRWQMLGGAKAFPVIGNHPVQQGIPDGFFALIVLVDAGLDQFERCSQFPYVSALISFF